MEGIRQKLAKLREDQETTEKKNEELNAENKELTRQIIDKENDMKSLQARIGVLDDEVAKADRDLKAAKEANGESESLRQEHDILQKRFQRLEAEAERSESVNAELKTNGMELTRKVENLNREIEGFNRRQLDNETNYKELEAKCKTVTDELDAIQSEIGNL